MKVTADTITDEQIRELRADVLHDVTPFEAWSDREASALLYLCDDALYAPRSMKLRARARCAEILNARK